MPSGRFAHGYKHDVFVSYTHADNKPYGGRRWVSEFTEALGTRLGHVSGRSVDVWRDEEKMGAADCFDDTIKAALADSAILLVVLSPSYFQSAPCREEREAFSARIRAERKELIGTKARVVKVVKFCVEADEYPPDLRVLLEHKFYEQLPGSVCKEFLLSEKQDVRDRHLSKLDDVAQEIAVLLRELERMAGVPPGGNAPPPTEKEIVYLAEATSDVEPQRDALRRQLVQAGFDVQPSRELRLLPARELREFIEHAIEKSRLVIHPLGRFYGFIPEGAEGKSVVRMQLELAQKDARNGDLPRIIWAPEGLKPEDREQEELLQRIRTEFAGHGFEFLERPFRELETRVTDRLRATPRAPASAVAVPKGTYLICDDADRAAAKAVRLFIFNQHRDIEWTPAAIAELAESPEHQRMLKRNGVHLVFHGQTGEGWIQDRINELRAVQAGAAARVRQAIFLADPARADKEDILARDIELLTAYAPATVGSVLASFLSGDGVPPSAPPGAGPPPPAGPPQDGRTS